MVAGSNPAGTNPTDYLYTSQRQEAGLGLYFYNARWYDPCIMQWTQPDTLIPEPDNTADWNRYLYARGNPLKYSDPSGHFPWPIIFGIIAVSAVASVGYEAYNILTTPAITEPRAPAPTSRDMTNWLVDRINENTSAPVTGALKDNLTGGNPINAVGAFKAWVGLVKGGAVWDYKADIIRSKVLDEGGRSPYVTLGNREENYQAIANINYGTMAAKIGLPQWVAEAGAGAAQVIDHWRRPKGNIGSWNTWFDDPADNYWIKYGYSYGQSRTTKATSNDFISSMNRYIHIHGEPPEPLGPGY